MGVAFWDFRTLRSKFSSRRRLPTDIKKFEDADFVYLEKEVCDRSEFFYHEASIYDEIWRP